MDNKKEPKIIEVLFDENKSYTEKISFVKDPAIQKDFLKFSSMSELYFSVDDEKREVLGAAMIPDVVIPRTEDMSVFFSKDSIRKHAMKFMRDGNQAALNMHHTSKVADSFVFQSYIVDTGKGVTAPKGLDVPDGTWIIGTKIESDELWNDIKNGVVKGFSIELSGMLPVDKTDEVKVIPALTDDELDKVYHSYRRYVRKLLTIIKNNKDK